MQTVFLLCWLTRVLVAKGDGEVFQQCIRNTPNPGLLRCVGEQTLSSLQNWDKMDNITVANGFVMMRNENNPRQRTFSEFFTEDPMDFRYEEFSAADLALSAATNIDKSKFHPYMYTHQGYVGERRYTCGSTIIAVGFQCNSSRIVSASRSVQ